jgi:hypothetical protein
MKINLTNQEIVKFAYVTKEVIENTWGQKLSEARANCYVECFYTIRDLLREVDEKYLEKHLPLIKFFLEGKRISHEDSRLKWEKYSDEIMR